MKLEELLPQLHDKMTYFICLDRTAYFPKLSITKTTNTKMVKLPLSFVDICLLSLIGQKTNLLGNMIINVTIDPKEIVEYKRDYIKFNENRTCEDWYIAQSKQGLVNAIKILFKKYRFSLSLSTYKYLITTIKNIE